MWLGAGHYVGDGEYRSNIILLAEFLEALARSYKYWSALPLSLRCLIAVLASAFPPFFVVQFRSHPALLHPSSRFPLPATSTFIPQAWRNDPRRSASGRVGGLLCSHPRPAEYFQSAVCDSIPSVLSTKPQLNQHEHPHPHPAPKHSTSLSCYGCRSKKNLSTKRTTDSGCAPQEETSQCIHGFPL